MCKKKGSKGRGAAELTWLWLKTGMFCAWRAAMRARASLFFFESLFPWAVCLATFAAS